ncbi:unnamed protein product [Protopolystoma xenopodis]|uniref:Uncharacterized protein n=1 Tax=Protopolystoma xenopodis TaxID=117903 RepID=A0A448WWR4_9PLAT|nr:unnamed protein product [Protopolystoma xenopodis]
MKHRLTDEAYRASTDDNGDCKSAFMMQDYGSSHRQVEIFHQRPFSTVCPSQGHAWKSSPRTAPQTDCVAEAPSAVPAWLSPVRMCASG